MIDSIEWPEQVPYLEEGDVDDSPYHASERYCDLVLKTFADPGARYIVLSLLSNAVVAYSDIDSTLYPRTDKMWNKVMEILGYTVDA